MKKGKAPFKKGDLVWADRWNPSAVVPRVQRVLWHNGWWYIFIESRYEARCVRGSDVYKLDVVEALANLA